MTDKQQTTTLRSMKEDNQRLLLRLLHENGKLSRKALAEKSGLTPAAVSKLTAALMEAGCVKETRPPEEASPADPRAGRREVCLQTTLEDTLSLGVYMELNAVTVSVARLDGKALRQKQAPFTGDLNAVMDLTEAFLDETPDLRQKLSCVGVCLLGAADGEGTGSGRAQAVTQAFTRRFGLPSAAENNVKAFVLAERVYGGGFGDRALFFKWGPGVGSAFYADGSVLSGSAGNVAEIGHYIVDPDGKKCRCGRCGCLETVCAEDALLRETGEKSLDALLKSADPAVTALLDRKIDTVAIALTNTSTIFSTRHIVLFGSMFRSPAVAEKLKKQMLRYNRNLAEEKIVRSRLNGDIAVVSPAAVCAERFFFRQQAIQYQKGTIV